MKPRSPRAVRFGCLRSSPGTFARALVLSLVGFLLIDVGAYLIAQSFTSPNVILNVLFRTAHDGDRRRSTPRGS